MSRPPTAEELAFVGAARFGRLATAGADGVPHAVPCCFALTEIEGEPAVVTPLDAKPKRVDARELQRVRDIRANPRATLLVDREDEDWTRLAWVQLRGAAMLLEPGAPGFDGAMSALRAKYPQYGAMPIDAQPVIALRGLAATSWSGGAPLGLPRPVDLGGIVRGRRSVRALRPDPVPRALVEGAIAAAGWAPSPHGRQPWRFAVIERDARKVALADAMAASWREQLALDGQDASVIEIRLGKSRERLLGTPVIVVPCLYLADLDEYPDPDRQAAERTMAVQSLGAAIQNFLLAIYASGLDTGWMCAPLFCPEVVRDSLGLERALIPQALLPVGYASKDPVRRPRLPADRLIVAWD